MLKKILAWFREEKGQDMIEYALISALISVAIVLAAVGILEGAFADWANGLADEITSFV